MVFRKQDIIEILQEDCCKETQPEFKPPYEPKRSDKISKQIEWDKNNG